MVKHFDHERYHTCHGQHSPTINVGAYRCQPPLGDIVGTPPRQQVLTWTSGGERLASGALDGSVVVWSMSAEGILVPVVTYGGLCLPYRLVAIGR